MIPVILDYLGSGPGTNVIALIKLFNSFYREADTNHKKPQNHMLCVDSRYIVGRGRRAMNISLFTAVEPSIES